MVSVRISQKVIVSIDYVKGNLYFLQNSASLSEESSDALQSSGIQSSSSSSDSSLSGLGLESISSFNFRLLDGVSAYLKYSNIFQHKLY